MTAEEVTDYAPFAIQISFGLIPLIEETSGGALVSRITGIRRDVSTAMGFVIPGVRIRNDMGLPANTYHNRIRRAVVAEDIAYPDRRLALPGGATPRKLRGVEVKDPSFGMDAVWIQPHQQPEANDYVVVEPESVIATHLSQMLYAHAAEPCPACAIVGWLLPEARTLRGRSVSIRVKASCRSDKPDPKVARVSE
nr:FHIPEP family type III secretion protein [uncultured Roseovarius sp.]